MEAVGTAGERGRAVETRGDCGSVVESPEGSGRVRGTHVRRTRRSRRVVRVGVLTLGPVFCCCFERVVVGRPDVYRSSGRLLRVCRVLRVHAWGHCCLDVLVWYPEVPRTLTGPRFDPSCSLPQRRLQPRLEELCSAQPVVNRPWWSLGKHVGRERRRRRRRGLLPLASCVPYPPSSFHYFFLLLLAPSSSTFYCLSLPCFLPRSPGDLDLLPSSFLPCSVFLCRLLSFSSFLPLLLWPPHSV